MGFSLFGFPTRIDPSFLIIVALLGFNGSTQHLLIWVALAVVGVLGHELGHALAARRIGGTATISLQGLGGLTRCVRAAPLTRRESAIFTVAGPAAGFLLGIPVLLALRSFGWEPWTTGGFTLRTAAFVTVGWSIFNLLPVLPFDGGSLLELALPGPALVRRLWAVRVSVVLAGIGALVAYQAGSRYTALLALLLAGQNLSTHKGLAQASRGHGSAARLETLTEQHDAGDFNGAVEGARQLADDTSVTDDHRVAARRLAIIALVNAGRSQEALTEAQASPQSEELGAGIRGLALAAAGDGEAGVTLARQAFDDEPGPANAQWLIEALRHAGRFDEAARFVEAHPNELSLQLAERAWATAFRAGDFVAAARTADAFATVAEPGHAALAYNAACSWSRAGDDRSATASLRTAIRLGWSDLGHLDTDEDLAHLRALPDWQAQRATLAVGVTSTSRRGLGLPE